MGVSAVAHHSASTAMPTTPVRTAGDSRAAGLSRQDQAAVIGARPNAFRNSALAAARLTSPDTAATGSASRQGSLDTYL